MSRANRRVIGLMLSGIAQLANASVGCTLSDFTIDAYDHTGTYISGNVNGRSVAFELQSWAPAVLPQIDIKSTHRPFTLPLIYVPVWS